MNLAASPRRFTTPLVVLASTLVLMGDDCGPAVGIQPAYKAGAVVTDDALVGKYTVVSSKGTAKKPVTATITKDETVDGPSYLLAVNDPTDTSWKNGHFRLFLFDVAGAAGPGVRFADAVAEASKKNMSGEWSLPVHLYLRLSRTPGDGVLLEYLETKWVDEERKKDPTITVLEAPRDYRKFDGELTVSRNPALSIDGAAVQKLLAKAHTAEDAWGVGMELTKPGAPALDFTLTSTTSEASKDGFTQENVITVNGTRIKYASSYSGRDSGAGAGTSPVNAKGVIKDTAKIDKLMKAFQKTTAAKPAKPIPKMDRTTHKICLALGQDDKKPRCVERLVDDDSGADRAAILELRAALLENVKLPPP